MVTTGYVSSNAIEQKKPQKGKVPKVLVCVLPGYPIGQHSIQFLKLTAKSPDYQKFLGNNTQGDVRDISIKMSTTVGETTKIIQISIFRKATLYSANTEFHGDLKGYWEIYWGLQTSNINSSNFFSPSTSKVYKAALMSTEIFKAFSKNDPLTSVKYLIFTLQSIYNSYLLT